MNVLAVVGHGVRRIAASARAGDEIAIVVIAGEERVQVMEDAPLLVLAGGTGSFASAASIFSGNSRSRKVSISRRR
jgi:ferredoxin-NADP reductase